jgi:hypothetical protein
VNQFGFIYKIIQGCTANRTLKNDYQITGEKKVREKIITQGVSKGIRRTSDRTSLRLI